MSAAYELYAADNTLDEYFAMKPSLNELQSELIEAFYCARRESASDARAKRVELEYCARHVPLDSDLALYVLQKLDDEYLRLYAQKLKRSAPNGR